MLMAGLEHVSCSMPAILCVSRRLPVATGPGAEVGTLAGRALGIGSRSGRYTKATVKRENLGHLGLDLAVHAAMCE